MAHRQNPRDGRALRPPRFANRGVRNAASTTTEGRVTAMATELFRPLYSSVGWKYRDAKQAPCAPHNILGHKNDATCFGGLLHRSQTWWIRVWHPTDKKVIRESTSTN